MCGGGGVGAFLEESVSPAHLMILLQAAQTGVRLLSGAPCWAACMMELRFCMGVGWAGWLCWVSTVLVLSGRYRSAKPGSVTHGGRQEGVEAGPAVLPTGLAGNARTDISSRLCSVKQRMPHYLLRLILHVSITSRGSGLFSDRLP